MDVENLLDKFWFRLVIVLAASVYITELGSVDALTTRLRTLDFYKEYVATVLISLSVVELVNFVNNRLEKKVTWHGHVLYRLLLQVLFGLFLPLVLVFIMAAIYFYSYDVDIMRTDYLYYGFPFVVVLILMLNVIFIMTPYCLLGIQFLKGNHAPVPVAQISEEIVEDLNTELRIKVQDGISVLFLRPDQIAATYIIDGRVIIRSKEEKEFLTDLTMDELEKEYLKNDTFFRLNRQLITSRTSCRAYKPLEYGKIEVELLMPIPVNAVVSQLKAKAFKEWINN
ncbi:LytTR family transcriptional regulator DNA-binding domain-containing protein [Sphingobacterium faecium]|uniref:LytTR family transcriptional regulator DNA-binding domain-containing protein n=1 Tax=Sphingobacterium faecium TaxID=34087 RepID=UPI000D36CDEE|nr:LytTR family transcriptional regulator DNA-binding domain-containing protein [Sphingobacterium faecium]PTX09448.1 LytTr DNA-binding domain-containing protein [Sphingobacterium faecium]